MYIPDIETSKTFLKGCLQPAVACKIGKPRKFPELPSKIPQFSKVSAGQRTLLYFALFLCVLCLFILFDKFTAFSAQSLFVFLFWRIIA